MTGVPLVPENNVTFILHIKNSISQFQLDKNILRLKSEQQSMSDGGSLRF